MNFENRSFCFMALATKSVLINVKFDMGGLFPDSSILCL